MDSHIFSALMLLQKLTDIKLQTNQSKTRSKFHCQMKLTTHDLVLYDKTYVGAGASPTCLFRVLYLLKLNRYIGPVTRSSFHTRFNKIKIFYFFLICSLSTNYCKLQGITRAIFTQFHSAKFSLLRTHFSSTCSDTYVLNLSNKS